MLEVLLHELPRTHGCRGLHYVVDDLRGLRCQEAEPHGEHVVPCDDGLADSVLLVEGLPSAPDLALVVDVVVDQGGAVDDLEGRADLDRLVHVLAAHRAVAHDAQCGPEALASGRYDVLAHLREFGVLGLEVVHHKLLDHLQFPAYAGVPRLRHCVGIVVS